MSWLKNKICDWFHSGGDIKRDCYGRINWQCRTCSRWAEPVDPQTERLIVDADIRKAIRARGGSMTDRELLELAAKAAKLEFDPTVNNPHGLMIVRDGAVCQSDQVLWNPLTDDGDALRLAVKLELLVDIETCYHVIACKELMACVEHIGNDGKGCIYAATRRAIVRAAAEIGKSMP